MPNDNNPTDSQVPQGVTPADPTATTTAQAGTGMDQSAQVSADPMGGVAQAPAEPQTMTPPTVTETPVPAAPVSETTAVSGGQVNTPPSAAMPAPAADAGDQANN